MDRFHTLFDLGIQSEKLRLKALQIQPLILQGKSGFLVRGLSVIKLGFESRNLRFVLVDPSLGALQKLGYL
jgi:hypothetical protein